MCVELSCGQDFDCSSKDYDIYHVEDFPWVDSVVPLLDRYVLAAAAAAASCLSVTARSNHWIARPPSYHLALQSCTM